MEGRSVEGQTPSKTSDYQPWCRGTSNSNLVSLLEVVDN